MYLEHFNFQTHPFSLTPNVKFFCNLSGHQAALNVLLFGLQSGEGFIKLIGEVGSGKTMLCRMLLNELKDPYVTVYLPNPDLDPMTLKSAIATELGLNIAPDCSAAELMQSLSQKLLALQSEGKKPVVIIDEAQALPDSSLEALRLLTNLETETTKLLQIVLFAQPELDQRLKRYEFRQLQQRIAFAHYLSPLAGGELDEYLAHRLVMAGYSKGLLFDNKARELLYQVSQGTPRVINILCHKALLVAYGLGKAKVDVECMRQAIEDSQDVVRSLPKQPRPLMLYSLLGVVIILLLGLIVLLVYT